MNSSTNTSRAFSAYKLRDDTEPGVVATELSWSAVASGARHRFGFEDHDLSSYIQSAVVISLCRCAPSVLSANTRALTARVLYLSLITKADRAAGRPSGRAQVFTLKS